tara:strand:+ start:5555 stop:6139 length:585 start_codon:yes stop_codon:yes gene_type:complete
MSNGINGYGLMIYNDGTRDVCGLLDGSPVLRPSRIENTENGRRFRFAEGKREVRSLGDIFCPNMTTAGFVREAVNEKLERDAAREEARQKLARTAFVVESVVERERGSMSFVAVHCSYINPPHERFHLNFVSGARRPELNMLARQELESFAFSLGLPKIDHVEDMIGRTASMALDDGTVVPWTPVWKPASERAA